MRKDKIRRILCTIVYAILVLCITGCGNSIITNQNNESNNIGEKKKKDNEIEKNPENPNSQNIDNSNSNENNPIANKYINSDDKGTYFILNEDNTFYATVNYCAGYYDISGTYELKYSNTLTGYEPKTLILSYDNNEKDTLKITKFSNNKIANLTLDLKNSDMVLSACSGYDFYREDNNE